MFKRPHSTKTLSPLRSSDLRKLRDELIQLYPLSIPHVKQLLPDKLLTSKATTHLDESITLYYAPSNEPDPRFIKISHSKGGASTRDLLVPTCYTFDLLPNLLPVLETAEQVIDNLQSGSALFTAGVSLTSLNALPDGIREGDLVAIVVYGQKERVVAVGQLGASKEQLVKDDRKGKAVISLHARGDYLWESGSKLVQPSLTPSTPSTSSQPSTSRPSSPVLRAHSPPVAQLAATSLSTSLTPSEVDTILHSALLLTLSTLPSTSYPIPASSLYSSHILPNRPAGTDPSLDLKKSSYKKLSGLIKFASKRGWLVSKEVRGELMIMNSCSEHQDVATFRGYRTLAHETVKEEKKVAREEAKESGQAGGGKEGVVIVNEYLKPSGNTIKQLISHFPIHEKPSNDLYTPHALRTLFLSYLSHHSLIHPNSQKHLILLPSSSPSPLSLESLSHQELLVSVLLKKGEDVRDWQGGVMSKEEGFKRLIGNPGGFSEYFGVLHGRGGEEMVKKGQPPKVRVGIKNVGKRQVTLITGLEGWDFLVSLGEFTDELKLKSASSVSSQPITGSAKKNQTPKIEIMCQGTHDKLVTTLLGSKGIPKKFVEVDLTRSKK